MEEDGLLVTLAGERETEKDVTEKTTVKVASQDVMKGIKLQDFGKRVSSVEEDVVNRDSLQNINREWVCYKRYYENIK